MVKTIIWFSICILAAVGGKWVLGTAKVPSDVLVIGGNFTHNGKVVTLLQYDLNKQTWAEFPGPQLFLYGRESTGVVMDIAVDTTQTFNDLYVVGIFDTVYSTSQIMYCGIGDWDGQTFRKVGEGLCPRGGDMDGTQSIQVKACTVLPDGSLFVGGTFESRVWNGKQFVSVLNVGHYDGRWLPLEGGPLDCDNSCDAVVSSLAWEPSEDVLYIGGRFNVLNKAPCTSGLAMWSRRTGLENFPGGGLLRAEGRVAEVTNMLYDHSSRSLFVMGDFFFVNGSFCSGIAVWFHPGNSWECLFKNAFRLDPISTIMVANEFLYVAGKATSASTFSGVQNGLPHAIAEIDLHGYVKRKFLHGPSSPRTGSSNSTAHGANSGASSKGNGQHKMPSSTQLSSQLPNLRPSFSPASSSAPMTRPYSDSVMDRSPTSSGTVGGYRRRTTTTNTHEHQVHNASFPLRGYNSSSSNERGTSTSTSASINGRGRVSHQVNGSGYGWASTASKSRNGKDTKWEPEWGWLDGFVGVDGPIERIIPGEMGQRGSIFIAGAFSPGVLRWTLGRNGGEMHYLGRKGDLTGVVSTVVQAQMHLQADPRTLDKGDMELPVNYTWIIFFSAIASGLLLGVGFAISCYKRSNVYSLIPDMDQASEGEEHTINLMALSGNVGDPIDFRRVFENAMNARHLPSHENLMVINPKEIVLSKIIGEGSFGRVWSGNWRSNTVAVKEFVFAQAVVSGKSVQRQKVIEEIVGEAGIMACLRHPKILQLYGCSLTMQAIWIVNELCDQGSLRMILNSKGSLSLATKVSLCLDVADGMLYLHTRKPPIIHRDLKSHNIFVLEPKPGRFVAKIGDWGSARAVALTGTKSMTYGVGTACWLAPEVIHSAYSSKASDVYAFGIVLWEAYSRSEVYEGLSAAQIISKVANEGLRPQVPPACPWASIMEECWMQDPAERPEFCSIMTHLSKIHSSLKARKPVSFA